MLFRTSTHSAALELELARRNIPFVKFGGLKFLEAAHVKDMLAVLRFAQNPRGRMAGFRVAQLVPGIGPATATRLLDAMGEAAEPTPRLQPFEAAGAGAGRSGRSSSQLYASCATPSGLAGRAGTRQGLVSAATASVCTTTRRCASSMSSSSRGWPRATPAASAS